MWLCFMINLYIALSEWLSILYGELKLVHKKNIMQNSGHIDSYVYCVCMMYVTNKAMQFIITFLKCSPYGRGKKAT